MMIQAVLGNPHHPEYGVATIPFPIPRDQHAHCMELLEALEIGDAVKADCKVEKIDSFYTVLKRVEMLTVNVEELNYLAKRLDSFDTGEAAQFQAMAHKLELFELKDLINLTFCCQQATVITDFSDLAAVGRDHYMNLHGGSASVDELNALDGGETARRLIENGGGTITPYGVVYDNGMKLEQFYLKKPLKQLVDTIVDALAELPEVSECYEVWNQIHEELNECYGHSTPWERLPLSQRKEFRKIKNDIIREAENIRLGLPTFEDERMQDEPEPESQKEEHQSYSVYEQAQRYRAAKAVLQDIYALDAEHTEAVKALEQLWEEGYTVAAHQLGKFYRDDLSTLRDHEKAEQWFRCSAEAGNDFSEYALGKLLLTQKRTVEALEWLDKAAEQGNQFARYRLGKIYLTGESVPKDVEKALAYLTASADQGNQFAQYALGKLYLFGRDVPPDREQAREWLIRAAAQGNEYARFFLDRFDQFRDPTVMLAATKLLHHMSRIFQSNSVPPSNPAGIRIDSKRRRRLMEKRMAMGHKADDREEQTQYQQSM